MKTDEERRRAGADAQVRGVDAVDAVDAVECRGGGARGGGAESGGRGGSGGGEREAEPGAQRAVSGPESRRGRDARDAMR
jgi:hypothetical protein